MSSIKTGDKVSWKWGSGTAEGTVASIHKESKTITTDGKEITRNGTEDNPAVVIEPSSGSKVLKLLSELQDSKS